MREITRVQEDRCTTSIVEAVAEEEGVESTELPPLYEVLDPDSLERLVENSLDSVRIEFTYYGYEIVVSGDEEIEVTKQTDTTSMAGA